MTDPIYDKIHLESVPLHTEQPSTAADAPAQVEAALQRNAHVIGFTELGPTHTALRQQIANLCATYNYGILYMSADDSAIAYRLSLGTVETGELDGGSPGVSIAYVKFVYHTRNIYVYAAHWPSDTPDNSSVRGALTQAVIAAMNDASTHGVSFLLADDNPSLPQRNPDSKPRKTLEAAGIVLIWAELDSWPDGVGATTIARNTDDFIVNAVNAYLSDPLGSDHNPGHGVYTIKRPA